VELAVLLLIAFIGAIGYGLWKWGERMDRKPPRGFEVKPNTGETPVPREKEKNHG